MPIPNMSFVTRDLYRSCLYGKGFFLIYLLIDFGQFDIAFDLYLTELESNFFSPLSTQSRENPRAARACSRNTEGPLQEHPSPKTKYNLTLY